MIILAFTLQTVTVTRKTLVDQHAQLLAKQAAESGLARARHCLYNNDREVTWTDATPLQPNTDCDGNPISGKDDFLTNNSRIKTTFSIRPSDLSGENSITASAKGIAEFIDASSNVIKTYSHFSSIFMKTKTTFNDITFGNIYAKKSESGGGIPTVTRQAYYILKTKLGLVKYAGSNLSYQLSGKQTSSPDKFYMSPTILPFPEGTKIDKIFTNYEGEGWNIFYLTDAGEVYGTGHNYNGQLATGPDTATYNAASFDEFVGNFLKGIFGFLTTSITYVPDWWDNAKMDLSVLNADEKVAYIYPTGLDTYVFTDQGRVFSAGLNAWNMGHYKYDNAFMGSIQYDRRVSAQLGQVVIPPTSEVDLGEDNRRAVFDIVKRKYYFDTQNSASTLIRMEGGAVLGLGGYVGRWCPSQGTFGVRDKKFGLGYEKEDGCGLARYLKMENNHYFGDTGQPKAIDIETDGRTSWIVDDNGDVWSTGKNSNGQLGRETNKTVCNGEIHDGNCYDTVGKDKDVCPADTYLDYKADDPRVCRKRKYNYFFWWSCDDPDYPFKNHNGMYCYSADSYPKICKDDQYEDASGKCHDAIGFDALPEEPLEYFYKMTFPAEATKIVKVVAAHKIAVFLTDSGQVYSVGLNDQGQLGTGNTDDVDLPKRYEVKDADNNYEIVTDIYVTAPNLRLLDGTAAKIVNLFVVTADGEVYGTGSNHYGQLGIGNPIASGTINNSNNGCAGVSQGIFSTPQKMKFFGEVGGPKAREVRAGFGTTMIITTNNRVYTVGNNSHGQLGIGYCANPFSCAGQEAPLIVPDRVCTPSDNDNINLAAPLIY